MFLTLTSGLNFRKMVSGAYILNICVLNLVCEYMLGSQRVAYCFRFTVSLASSTDSRKIMSGHHVCWQIYFYVSFCSAQSFCLAEIDWIRLCRCQTHVCWPEYFKGISLLLQV